MSPPDSMRAAWRLWLREARDPLSFVIQNAALGPPWLSRAALLAQSSEECFKPGALVDASGRVHETPPPGWWVEMRDRQRADLVTLAHAWLAELES